MTDPISWQSLLPAGYGQPVVPVPVIETPEIAPPATGGGPDAHPITDSRRLDASQLQEDLVRALGRDVAITVSYPTSETGELRIADPKTGLPLDVDRRLVARVLSGHEPAETNEAQFLREYDSAEGLEAKLDAVRDYVVRQIDAADWARHLQRRGERHVATARSAVPMSDTPRPPLRPRVTSRNPWTQRMQRGEV